MKKYPNTDILHVFDIQEIQENNGVSEYREHQDVYTWKLYYFVFSERKHFRK